MGYTKNLVYSHVYDELFLRSEPLPIPDAILAQFDSNLPSFLKPLTMELKNQLPTLPVTKASLNNAPFDILPVLRHILSKYEEIINVQTQNIIEDKKETPFVPPRHFNLFQTLD
jgi:hypothetical protein